MPSGFPNQSPVRLRGAGGRFASNNFGFYWQGLEVTTARIKDYARRMHKSTEAAGRRIANDMEVYAKANHPWHNRSGDAEEGLKAVVVLGGDKTTISLGHSVTYGPSLETRNGGVDGIILPTLLQFAPLWAGYVKDALYAEWDDFE